MSDESNFDENGRFKAGNTVGAKGRPKGARSRLGEAFLQDLEASWQDQGISAIERVIKDRPHEYLKVVAGLLPKDVNVNVTEVQTMTDEQLRERIQRLNDIIGPFLGNAGIPGDRPGTAETTTH